MFKKVLFSWVFFVSFFLTLHFLILVQLGSLSDSPPVNIHERRICAYKNARTPREGDEALIVTDPSPRKSCWLRRK